MPVNEQVVSGDTIEIIDTSSHKPSSTKSSKQGNQSYQHFMIELIDNPIAKPVRVLLSDDDIAESRQILKNIGRFWKQ